VASATLLNRPDALRERLRQVPDLPGVYVMRDERTRVVYVGKAINLRNRLRTYFQDRGPLDARIAAMVARVFDFDILTCSSEQEALLLECNLIKRYRPRYNIRLRDDKNYLYMKLPRTGDFPRVYTVRKVADDGARYFGPYTNAKALRSTMKTLRRIFPYRTCSDDVFRRGRVCLDYHIKRCSGPCEGLIGSAEYRASLEQIGVFMEGRADDLVRTLQREMREASDGMEYERAARLRDRAIAVDKVAERQRVLSQVGREQDVVGLARSGADAVIAVVTVRRGQVTGSETFELEGAADMDETAVVNGFLGQFYGNATSYPREVLLPAPIEDAEVLSGWLSQRRGTRVDLLVPQRGQKLELVRMAARNAEAALKQATVKKDYDAERSEALLSDLQDALGLDAVPRRIECYDISNLMGTNPVGSMVVFEDGRPRNAHYRHFHIRGIAGANDFAMLQEMLRRRFVRLTAAMRDRVDNGSSDGSFSSLPDLVIVDGGKGQLSAAREVLEELELQQLPVFGLAKKKEELYQPGSSRSILLPLDSPALFLLQRIRDEAHRFGITFHRRTRARRALGSPLDGVAGLGPVRKRALMRRFRSIEGIRNASDDELLEVLPANVVLALKENF
jgi:excinuclease ABC subunit C